MKHPFCMALFVSLFLFQPAWGATPSNSSVRTHQLRMGQVADMLSPDGNQIEVISLPGQKSLSSNDLEFFGRNKIVMAGSCLEAQKNMNLRLTSMEYELELRLLIQKLRRQNKPRRLSQVQKALIHEVPACEDFQWELAIISKLLKNYDLLRSRQIKVSSK